LAESAHRKGIELVCLPDTHLPAQILGDPGRFQQVIMNLLGNALKFTPSGGSVTVALHAIALEDPRILLRVEVQDTGIGIPEDVLPGLFQPYVQAERSITRSYGGTGLGLAICKRFLEAMGGRIGVESHLGRGSRFWFELPSECVSSKDLALEPLPEGSHLLALTHSPLGQEALSRICKTYRIEAEFASSQKDLATLFQRFHHHGQQRPILLLDPLTEEDHAQWILEARKLAGPTVPILLLSALNGRVSTLIPASAGFVVHLAKPVRRVLFHRALRQCLGLEPVDAECHQHGGSQHVGRGRILVVDDNETNRKVARFTLESLGHTCTLAVSAEEALEILERESFDVVLMDCNLPGMDGFEATRAIRAREGQERHTVILALTAHSVEHARKRAREAGMDGYLAKPLRRNALQKTLCKWMPKPSSLSVPQPTSDANQEALLDVHTWSGLEYLEKTTGPGAIAELVQDFENDAPKRLVRMREALAFGHLDQLSRLAHDLKSNSATLGAYVLSNVAEHLERGAAGEVETDLNAMLDEAERQLLRALDVMKLRQECY
jgi:CheY-like chemotaxis protein/HPt (histidine-containing phosphotransfer) domain-containing protein